MLHNRKQKIIELVILSNVYIKCIFSKPMHTVRTQFKDCKMFFLIICMTLDFYFICLVYIFIYVIIYMYFYKILNPWSRVFRLFLYFMESGGYLHFHNTPPFVSSLTQYHHPRVLHACSSHPPSFGQSHAINLHVASRLNVSDCGRIIANFSTY